MDRLLQFCLLLLAVSIVFTIALSLLVRFWLALLLLVLLAAALYGAYLWVQWLRGRW